MKKQANDYESAGVRFFFPDPAPVFFFFFECTFTGSGVGVVGWSSTTSYWGNEVIDDDRPEDIRVGAGLAVREVMDPGRDPGAGVDRRDEGLELNVVAPAGISPTLSI